jgi:hypothetical protein
MKGHAPESRITGFPGIAHRMAHIHTRRTCMRNDLPGAGIEKRLSFAITRDPFPGHITFKFPHKFIFWEGDKNYPYSSSNDELSNLFRRKKTCSFRSQTMAKGVKVWSMDIILQGYQLYIHTCHQH